MKIMNRIISQQYLWLLVILYAITHSILINLSLMSAFALFFLFFFILISIIYKDKINISLIFFHIGTLLISLTTFRLGGEFFNGSDLFYLLSALLLFTNVLVSKGNLYNLFIKSNPLLIPLLMFIFGSVLSMMVSDDIRRALISTGKYIFLFGIWLPFGIFLLDNIVKIRWMFIILIAASLIPIITCLSDYFFHTKMTVYIDHFLSLNINAEVSSDGSRFGSVMGHPNNFTTLLIAIFPISLWLTLFSKVIFMRICGSIYLLSVLSCVMITGSRGGIVAFALESFLLYISTIKRSRFFSLIIAVLIGLAIYVFIQTTLVLFPQNPFGRLDAMLSMKVGKYRPDVERIESINQAISYIQEYPITGIGAEHVALMTRKLYVHNTLFRLWASIGIFGLLSYLWFYGKPLLIWFKGIYKTAEINFEKRNMIVIILCSFSGSLLFDMTSPQFHNRIKWIFVILLFALQNIERREIEAL